ncbi:hypothetical protein [Campylobacter hyointestinalis]|nr:hypothetical protein [Campylobacter hyointestinalis]
MSFNGKNETIGLSVKEMIYITQKQLEPALKEHFW